MDRNATLLLTGVTVVGGFVLGKSVIDHIYVSKHLPDEDVEEFEAQHYRAAGFVKKGRPLDDMVALISAIGGIYYVLTEVPKQIEELRKL